MSTNLLSIETFIVDTYLWSVICSPYKYVENILLLLITSSDLVMLWVLLCGY